VVHWDAESFFLFDSDSYSGMYCLDIMIEYLTMTCDKFVYSVHHYASFMCSNERCTIVYKQSFSCKINC